MKLGFHVSIEGGVDRAVNRAKELGCSTFQIFTRSPRMWKHRELEEGEVQAFKLKLRDSGISPVFSHMPYLPNLSSPKDDMFRRSVETLVVEAARCRLLDIPYLVTHLGSTLGSGYEAGVERIAKAFSHLGSGSPMLLIENTSGKRNEVGSTFRELRDIIDSTEGLRLGVCLDTCHAYARGYDVKSEEGFEATIDEFDEIIGLRNLHLVHLNDSKGPRGSRIDRHEHIGLGEIGDDGFRNILSSRLREAPMVMETPADERRGDGENMMKVYQLAGLHVG
ncbi:MAG: deoxyribonuclease IV [Candidatus Bathyarchaeota archaeon]